jgi:glycosyltransferase involved in cell wall biosynthesis
MRIHCVSVVRDEADIIGYNLDAALRWADAIHVLDNGSTDGTWEILQDYAAREPRVVVAGRYEGKFDNRLRGEVANRAAASARSGDWWCRLDADEFYVDDPREFLSDIPSRFGVVRNVSITYYFTDVDLRAYEADPAGYVANWSPEMIRYYRANWSERRFIRHRPDVPWDGAWPHGSGELGVALPRIWLRHYQYRSPPQIERRLQTRITHTAEDSFPHEKRHPRTLEKIWPTSERATEILLFPETAPGDPLWKSRVVRSEKCHFDALDGRYVIDWEALPPHPPGRPRPQTARQQ